MGILLGHRAFFWWLPWPLGLVGQPRHQRPFRLCVSGGVGTRLNRRCQNPRQTWNTGVHISQIASSLGARLVELENTCSPADGDVQPWAGDFLSLSFPFPSVGIIGPLMTRSWGSVDSWHLQNPEFSPHFLFPTCFSGAVQGGPGGRPEHCEVPCGFPYSPVCGRGPLHCAQHPAGL